MIYREERDPNLPQHQDLIQNFGIILSKLFGSLAGLAFAMVLSLQFVSFSATGQTHLRESNQDDRYYAQLLERKAELMSDSMLVLERNLKTAKIVMLSQSVKRKAWIKVLAAETAVVAGVILVATTGALVPVCMGVLAFEIALLLEGNYRLNTRNLKKIRREQPEKIKEHLN